MAKFVKKPVVIEAFQYKATGFDETRDYPQWLFQAILHGKIKQEAGSTSLLIETFEGVMKADSGDWIIQGVKGELYPCKPDIFELTYEKVQGHIV